MSEQSFRTGIIQSQLLLPRSCRCFWMISDDEFCNSGTCKCYWMTPDAAFIIIGQASHGFPWVSIILVRGISMILANSSGYRVAAGASGQSPMMNSGTCRCYWMTQDVEFILIGRSSHGFPWVTKLWNSDYIYKFLSHCVYIGQIE